ncbi:MAG: 50S ribosomal protein L9 [Erysipelotrichaceae bacterium]|nr:50S ribosomal protein L9 [Erysipelotrichaceae bacterium]MDD3924289.1 50S ribosomal protein L9 [Erysipelotrichaceae bacterium]MDD4642506.1 50S ribosomal protein L9 [Erysipelotrichaceae bacterium]
MKVILLADVKNVGKKGEIVEVSDGYGRNYLIRNKLAVMASDKSLEVLAEQKEQNKADLAAKKAQAEVLAERLKNITLEFSLSAGTDGRLFGSISSKQVVSELSKIHGIAIDKKKFIDNGPFSEMGRHIIKVELFKNVIGEIKIDIKTK